MPRSPRLDYPGGTFHVISRGNDRQPIFLAEDDFQYFFSLLLEARSRMGCRFFAYCFLPNHFHLLIRTEAISLSRIMHFILATYARRFNLKFARCGHVFEDRFKSFPCTNDRYLLASLRYIHLNPVRAGIVQKAGEWKWSGHRELTDPAGGGLLDRDQTLSFFGADPETEGAEYLSFLERDKDSKSQETLGKDKATVLPAPPTKPIALVESLADIGLAVADETGTPVQELRGSRRTRSVSGARKIVALRSSAHGYSVSQIAEYLRCSVSAVSQMLSREAGQAQTQVS